jgi:hypothetical protein
LLLETDEALIGNLLDIGWAGLNCLASIQCNEVRAAE